MFLMHYRLIFIFTLIISNSCYAARNLILDGREIQLNDDGTWQYLSTDRFIDTPDGKRIRLQDNGQWEYIGNTPLKAEQRQRTSTLDMQLKDVVIERTEKKVQKNVRVRTQTVFTIDIQRAEEADGSLGLAGLDLTNVSVTDNNGKAYEIIRIDSDRPSIGPGESATISVIADKSPLMFDDVKSMSVTFRAKVFNAPNDITLTRELDDIDEVKVDKFDEVP
jgi:hypothetical protein